MRILVANDDGIAARGLAILEAVAWSLSDDVWVVAPDGERSWQSRAHTSFAPIHVTRLGEHRFAISGTPADCVMIGIRSLMQNSPPDLVLSGINHGSNLGEEVSYSGTVGAAMEATVCGIRAIALSQLYDPVTKVIPWAVSERFAGQLVRELVGRDWPSSVLMSVNLPPVALPDAVTGIRFTQLARRNLATGIYRGEARIDPHGRDYYWAGMKPNLVDEDPDSDVSAVAAGAIAVTPVHLDLTQYDTLRRMREQPITLA